MIASRRALVAAAVACFVCSVAGTARAWRTDVAGTPSPSRPSDVTALADGTAVAAGRIAAGSAQAAFVVALEGGDGAERWRRTVAGTDATANDVFRRAVPGPAGSVIVAGRLTNLATGPDAVVARLAAADGADIWTWVGDGGAGLGDDAQDIAVLPEGDVLAVGRLDAGAPLGGLALWRLDGATGQVEWTAHLGAPGAIGRRVAVASETAYVAGETDPTGANDEVLVAAVALADGTVGWTRTIAGDAGANDDAVGIAVAGDQVTVLAEVEQAATGPGGLVVALDAATGAERWRAAIDGATTGGADDDAAAALALAPNGDPVVAGSVGTALTSDDLLLLRLDAATGAVVWRTELDGGNAADDEARGLAIAFSGATTDAFVTGRLREPNVGGQIGVLRFELATGAVVWRRAIEGGSDRNDLGLAIAVDGAGDVVVGGRARRDATGDEFAVLKLAGASGGSLPCGNGVTDPGEECDDANPTLGDGCRPDCTAERCGDGILDPGEDCDDATTPCCTGACLFAPPTTACDDGDACTRVDTCLAGACLGDDPVVCAPDGPCDTTDCDPATGECVTTLRPDATACSDGDACTRNDQCRAGVCVGGAPEVCDDFDPCTLDACDPATGCTATPLTGIAGVACAVDEARLDRQCGVAVPRPIARRVAKAVRLVGKVEAAPRPRRARRLLRALARTARRTVKASERLRKRSRLPVVCADTVADIFTDVETRAQAERELLR